MLLLAFDTATPAVTVALHDGTSLLAEANHAGAARHGELLAPAIASVLGAAGANRSDVTDIAVGVGPGPFTGLRVGVVTARTLGAVLDVPVHGVCTLDVLAFEAALDAEFLVATDARRKEVYWASYAGPRTRVDGPYVASPAEVATGGPVVGRGAQLYPEHFADRRPPLDPSAAVLAAGVAGGLVPVLPPQPLYLRRPDVAEPRPRKPVS